MDEFIARSHYLDLFNHGHLDARKARDLVKLLIVEKDKPSQSRAKTKSSSLAESRAAKAPNEDELPTLARLLL